MHRLIQKQNERSQSTFLDPIVMFGFIWVSFVIVLKTVPGLHLIHRVGQKRNDAPIRARNKTNAPNPLFLPSSDVLVHFGQFHYCAENHAEGAFTASIWAENETMHRFVQKQNKRTQSTFMDPIVMFGFVWVSFIIVSKTMSWLHLMHRVGQKRNEAPIRARNETMHRFGPETKRTHPIHFFWNQY